MHAALRFFSSLKLVITCLAFAMLIVVFGTLDQVDIGIQSAQKKYFEQIVVRPTVDGPLGGETFNTFIQSLPASPLYAWIFKTVPLPGGYLIGGVMLAGLIVAYFTRFKVGPWRVAAVAALCVVETWAMLHVGYSTWPGWLLMLAVTLPNLALIAYAHYRLRWPKVGVMLTHIGIVIMLVGGLLTSLWQRETRMIITTGDTANYSASDSECELAIASDAGDGQEDVVAIPQSVLAKGGTIALPGLPFAVKVRTFMPNSDLFRLGAGEAPPQPVTAGYGTTHKASLLAPTGKQDERNFMAAYIDLVKDGQPLGTYLVSIWGELFPDKLPAQSIEVGGKTYALRMRPARFYKPFSLTLLKFSHDKYKGTEKPRNFSSLVKLRDPRNGEDSTRLIKMNEPLRYEGETFFQASFLPGDRTTILQVVKNPAAWLPYVSCMVVSLGMMLQFLVHLLRFTQKRANA